MIGPGRVAAAIVGEALISCEISASLPSGVYALASPKSRILTLGRPDSSTTLTFAGLRSR